MPESLLTDPRGFTLRLTDRTWFAHILRGHPELAPLRDAVEQAVKRPLAIHASRSSSTAWIYYGDLHASPGTIMAVVGDTELGLVKTAYLTRRRIGPQTWP